MRRLAHVVRAELGGHAVLGQVTTRTWTAERGRLDAEAALAMAVPDAGPYLVSTAAFAVENTHNFGGGTVQPMEQLRRAARRAPTRSASRVHLDGARLWNAHVATGVPLADVRRARGHRLGLPVARASGRPSARCWSAPAERIAAARVWRKRYGGGMRQVGVLAAAGRYALDHHVDRLADDHARARRLAGRRRRGPARAGGPGDVETNIVVLDLPGRRGLAAGGRDRGRGPGARRPAVGARAAHAAPRHPPRTSTTRGASTRPPSWRRSSRLSAPLSGAGRRADGRMSRVTDAGRESDRGPASGAATGRRVHACGTTGPCRVPPATGGSRSTARPPTGRNTSSTSPRCESAADRPSGPTCTA